MLRSLRRPWSWLAFAGLLLAGGCSKDTSEEGPPPPTCSRWTPGAAAGPGDAARHFPLETGNRWVSRSTGTSSGTWASVQEVAGKRAVLGWDAAVLAQTDLDTHASLGEAYVAVDDHGVVGLGEGGASDLLTASMIPYYVARFPVAAGDSFTSVDCRNQDYGEDLDGDGKNERFDVRLVVTVAAIEPVATPIASFPEAARIEQLLTLTVRASGSPLQQTVDGRSTSWYAPGVGPVREVDEVPLGTPLPPLELLGYAVGGTVKGLQARWPLVPSVHGPYAAAFDGTRFLVAGAGQAFVADPMRLVGVPVTTAGSVGPPLDLIAIPRTTYLEISAPALAAGGGVVAAVASTWDGVLGEVRLQRVTPAGTLLEAPQGKGIGPAVAFTPWGCGPALASDGTGFLAVWIAEDRLRAVRLGASGEVLGETAIGGPSAEWPRPLCPVVDFDGSGYLVVYQAWDMSPFPAAVEQLRAVHVGTDGVVAEAAPLQLTSTIGTKRPIAMVFDGAAHVLLLADGRDGVSTALTLRRLSPAAAWLDGDAATGGIVLVPDWASTNGASVNGESVTLAGSTPVVAWSLGEAAWVTRLSPEGIPLDLHGGLPGVNAYLGDPASCGGVKFPVALGGADGVPEVIYSLACRDPPFAQSLRGVRFGL